MGLPRTLIKLIATVVRERGISGSALVIGKQDVIGTFGQVSRWLSEVGVRPEFGPGATAPGNDDDPIDDLTLFRLMGFEHVDSLDYSAYEGANLIHDLNQPAEPSFPGLRGRYDLVIDSGNTEHVFDVPQVLANFHFFVRTGGTVIHALPSSNYVDHGFYMFSPTLFHDYYTANGWNIACVYLVEQRDLRDRRPRRIYRYRPGALDDLSAGGMGRNPLLTFVAVEKTPHAGVGAGVQQRRYMTAWGAGGAATTQTPQTAGPRSLRSLARRHLPPGALEAARALRAMIRRPARLKDVLEFVAHL